MKRPNLFLVGAPKCGTTSMHEYLAQHPQICMSKVKEPHFFGKDLELPEAWRIRDEARYQGLFEESGGERWLGESSVWYLYSQTAAEEIRAYSPSARILIMLRNPVDTMYSLHGQYLYSGNEDIADFEEAFNAQADRRTRQRMPPYSRNPRGLLYSDVVSYTGQVRRYFDVFGRENVHVVLFDDFTRNTLETYRGMLRFLEVDEAFTPDLRVVNWAKPIRIPMLIRMDARLPFLRRAYHALVPPLWRGSLVDAFAWITRAKPRPPKLAPEVRARLLPLWTGEVEALSELLGRDLTGWCRAKQAANGVSGTRKEVGTH